MNSGPRGPNFSLRNLQWNSSYSTLSKCRCFFRVIFQRSLICAYWIDILQEKHPVFDRETFVNFGVSFALFCGLIANPLSCVEQTSGRH